MTRMRVLLPALLALASLWWTACDSRSTGPGNSGDPTDRPISRVEVSVQNSTVYYSQSSRTAVRDTVTVLVLDAERSAIVGQEVRCQVQSSFGGAMIAVNSMTDDNGEAKFVFRVLASDAPFEGEQEVTFVATAGNRTGTAALMLLEQSDIQLSFLNPASGTTIHRMEDPAETLPVQVYAYRDVVVDGQSQRVGVPGVSLNFSVSAVGQGIPGTISAQGLTGADGVTSSVYYANAFNQPADTVAIRFIATVAGDAELNAISNVSLANDYGYRLQRILPQNPDLHSDQLCQDSTRFVYQYVDRSNNPVAGVRFNIAPSFGELTDNSMYSLVSDDAGILTFAWRSCALEGGDLVLNMVNSSGRAFSYLFNVADARPIELYIFSPVPGGELEIDSECLDENVTNVKASLRYNDSGTAIVGRTITFSASFGQMGASAITDANGVAQVTWHDCDENHAGQELTLGATLGVGGDMVLSDVAQYPVDLPLGTPHHIALSVSNPILPDPDTGALQSAVIATVYNSQNQRLGAGLPVSFKTNGVGTVSTSAFTDDQGQATATFSLNAATGVSQLQAYYVAANTTDTLRSTSASITVNSGLPSNITLSTSNPRIQILGFGAASVAQVSGRVVDASGATVTMDIPVRFTIQAAPEGVYLSRPGFEDQYFFGDTLDVVSQDGMANITVNAGRTPGIVQITALVDDPNIDVYSTRALISVVAGPPAYGTLDFDPTGDPRNGAIWRVRWSVHLWDRYSNDVEDSTAVYFYLDPPNVASFDGEGRTGFDADGEPGTHGIGEDWMTYHCSSIGDTIDAAWAVSAGELPIISPFGDTLGWEYGALRITRNPANPTFQLPFQAGDRDDNLTVSGSTSQVVFPMDGTPGTPDPCTMPAEEEVVVTGTLIDGFGCPVSDQLIIFWCDFGGEITVLPDWACPPEWGMPPFVGVTDGSGVCRASMMVSPAVLQNTGAPCAGNENCWSWGTYTLNFGAQRLPDYNPSSNNASVLLMRPCQ